MFTVTTEYALRAAVCLGESDGLKLKSSDIAATTHVPVRYMSKVLQLLAEAGVALSQRGPNGGFMLARPAEEITLLDVVQAVEPVQRIRSCPLSLPEHCAGLCPLHRAIDDLAGIAERRLRETTLAAVMSEPLVPLGIRGRRTTGSKGSTFPRPAPDQTKN